MTYSLNEVNKALIAWSLIPLFFLSASIYLSPSSLSLFNMLYCRKYGDKYVDQAFIICSGLDMVNIRKHL